MAEEGHPERASAMRVAGRAAGMVVAGRVAAMVMECIPAMLVTEDQRRRCVSRPNGVVTRRERDHRERAEELRREP